MEQEVYLEFRGDHIYIRHGDDFVISPDSMAEFWDFLAQTCRLYDCRRVLAEGPPPHREMSTVDAFHSGVRISETVPDLWLAICFHGYEPDEVSDLFKQAARNRGVHVKFFSDQNKALKWLQAGSV